MTSDVEKSFKAKLRLIAKEQDRSPADLWQTLMLERLLVRLSRSQFQNHFVLKGATLLSRYLPIGRETKDLDFLAMHVRNNVKEIEGIFQHIAATKIEDGFDFRDIKAEELTHPHMNYGGVNVSMFAYFGKTRSKLTIDIGFGDFVRPVQHTLSLLGHSKGSLFEKSLSLPCYPKEFIFAEKLETVVKRGGSNSRMKDFHDLYSLSQAFEKKDFSGLKKVVEMVFAHRGTNLDLPLEYLSTDFTSLQRHWERYRRRLKDRVLENLPDEFSDLIMLLNTWISVL